jgi:hypothetical protein
LPNSDEGCAICGSSWGDYWDEVEGVRRFFCCDVCALQFREVVAAVRDRTGWPRVDGLTFVGDRRGRTGTATHDGSDYRFAVAFNSLGRIRRFAELAAPEGSPR